MDAKHETLVRAGRSPLSTTALLTVCVCVVSNVDGGEWLVVARAAQEDAAGEQR